ncbi:MAG: Dabb family protein [Acidimicrobiales bacterium]
MIRHTVLLTFDGVEESLVQTVIDELERLPGLIPEIRSYSVGRDLGLGPGTATLVIAADFDSVDGYETYSGHPEHVRVLDDHIRPHVTALTRAQIELDG